jgi:hypothetical protein
MRLADEDAAEELRIHSEFRRQLITERIRLVNRVQADLVIVVPLLQDQGAGADPTHSTRRGPDGCCTARPACGSSCCVARMYWVGRDRPRNTQAQGSARAARHRHWMHSDGSARRRRLPPPGSEGIPSPDVSRTTWECPIL